MGIQLDVTAFAESPEDRERRRRSSTRKRILALASTLLVTVVARFIIKDPQPPAVPDYSKDEVRYIPGMLEALPASERVRLDPKIVAKMIQADEKALRGTTPPPESMLAHGSYRPAEPKLETDLEAEAYKEQVFAYAQKRRIEMKHQETMNPEDLSKTILVRFRGGGYVKAEKTGRTGQATDILIDKTIHARVPNHIVASISANALTWEEPVPPGFVKLKPARGITITIGKNAASRISSRKVAYDEI